MIECIIGDTSRLIHELYSVSFRAGTVDSADAEEAAGAKVVVAVDIVVMFAMGVEVDGVTVFVKRNVEHVGRNLTLYDLDKATGVPVTAKMMAKIWMYNMLELDADGAGFIASHVLKMRERSRVAVGCSRSAATQIRCDRR